MDKIEVLKLKSELIYKKLIVFLSVAGGSGAYAVRFYEHGAYAMEIFFIVTFLIAALGITINFQEINSIKQILEKER